jgi:catechol 2,3-dioxygenase
VAIHVPKRTDMAQFAVRALQRGVRIAPTDHLVSEAIYLWDLDGNGIEITFETPWRGTLGDPESGSYATTSEGKQHSGREPIDMDDLLGELGENPTLEARMPAGTRIGTCMCTSTISISRWSFTATASASVGCSSSSRSAWRRRSRLHPAHDRIQHLGRPERDPSAGRFRRLRWFTIVVPDAVTLDDVRARLTARAYAFGEIGAGIETRDPSGNLVKIVVAN